MTSSGIVTSVSGIVKAIAVDGKERILQTGDRVLPNEQILTGDAGTILIEFSDGSSMDLGRNSNITLNDESLNPESGFNQQGQTLEQAQDEVAAIQQALAKGEFDPSKLEATAAGGAPGAGGLDDDGHTIVEVNYLNPTMTPESGFDTTGVSAAFLQPEGNLILDPQSNQGVEILDLTPAVEGGEATVSDANLAEGSSPDSDALTQVRDFTISIPDGFGTLTIGGVAVIDAGGLTGNIITTELGNEIIVTAYNAVTGMVTYSYTLTDNETHTQPENDDSLFDNLAVVLTDSDGDTDTDILSIQVLDDLPTVDIQLASQQQGANDELIPSWIPTLTTFDGNTIDANSDTASASFASLFTLTQNMGADDEGTPATLGYNLSMTAANGASGLSSEHKAITLSMNNGVVEGKDTAGTLIFAISVDAASGVVTLTQYEEIDHLPEDLDGVNDNFNIGLSDGAIALTAAATIVDGDQDSASDSETVDISSAIGFDDDLPTLNIELVSTALPTLTTQDKETIDVVINDQNVAVTDTDAASFAGLFSLTQDMGADDSGSSVSLGYSLSVTAGGASGLSSNNKAITLSMNSGVVEGKDTSGTLIFAISVGSASGVVTLTQYEALDHLPEDIDGVNDNYNIGLADGSIGLTAAASIVDGDQDNVAGSKTVDISSAIRFDDDLPSLKVELISTTLPTLTTQDKETIDIIVNEQNVAVSDTDFASFAGLFSLTQDMGADGSGSLASLGYSLSVTAAGGASGLSSENKAITLSVNNSVVEGKDTNGTLIFAISVDAVSGVVTLTQYEEIDHLPEDLDDVDDNSNIGLSDGAIALTAAATIVDGDHDNVTGSETVDISSAIRFDDDLPSLNIELVSTTLPTLTTQDKETIDVIVNEQNVAVNDTDFASFAGLFSLTQDMGADDSGTSASLGYSLSITAGGASGLSSNNKAITLSMNSNVVEGKDTDGTLIFAISVHPVSGVVTLTQYEALDHLPEDIDGINDNYNIGLIDGSISLTATASIVDGDQDNVTDSETVDISSAIRFDDDTPDNFVPDHAHIVLDVDGDGASPQTVTQALNFIPGADSLGNVVFTITEGQAFLSNEGKQLFFNNDELFLHFDGDSQHIKATTATGDLAFTAVIDAHADVSVTVFSGTIISDSEIVTVTDLKGIGGGNVPFKGLNIGTNNDPDSNTTDDVLVSSEIMPLGGDAGTVNSSANTLGVGHGEEVSLGEVIRYDLVQGLVIDDTTGSESYTFSDYQESFSFRQHFTITGNGKDADFNLRIYNESGAVTAANTSMVEGQGGTGQLTLTAAEVIVYNSSDVTQSGHVITNSDGSVTVTDIGNGWWFEIASVDTSLDPQAFNAIEIEGIETSGDEVLTSFKLAEFSYGDDTEVDPVTFGLPVTGIDGDGDSVDSQVDITVYPDTKSVVGSDEDDFGANQLNGQDGQDDYIFGLNGDDELDGQGGNDILLGGQGNDILTGGTGSDTYIWQRGDEGTDAIDTVTDFTHGPNGDTIDLSDLLQSESASSLADYLTVTSDGTHTTIMAAIDGLNSGTTTQTIVLEGVDLTDASIWGGALGAVLTSAEVIDNLLDNDNLVVD